jgi:mono/diheme cytochrome c family protein
MRLRLDDQSGGLVTHFHCARGGVLFLKHTKQQSGGCSMRLRYNAGPVCFMLAAGVQVAAAQPFPAADGLTPQQMQGRNLFNQSCMVCHVRLQITSPAKYGPDLSKDALGGQAAVMRDVISNGTPNMPGFKYHFEPDQIDAIVAYLKALPGPAPAANSPR